jgi:hypothetical protein
MNERIRELAEQTEEWNADGDKCEVNLQKFAELLIRECHNAVLSVPCYYKDYRSQIEEAVINDCARAVKEHFGVKE